MICCLSALSLYYFVFCLDCITFKQQKKKRKSWHKAHQMILKLFQWLFGYQQAMENFLN
jgi:hypothetical protein